MPDPKKKGLTDGDEACLASSLPPSLLGRSNERNDSLRPNGLPPGSPASVRPILDYLPSKVTPIGGTDGRFELKATQHPRVMSRIAPLRGCREEE